MSEFQPPDVEEDRDAMWDEQFARYEKNGYAVLSRDEWQERLDQAARDGYAEGRNDEAEEMAALLPGVEYMDPPDGGDVPLQVQFERMAKDAARYRWLRNSEWEMFESRWLNKLDIYGQGPMDMDAAIDQAMAAKEPA